LRINKAGTQSYRERDSPRSAKRGGERTIHRHEQRGAWMGE